MQVKTMDAVASVNKKQILLPVLITLHRVAQAQCQAVLDILLTH